ncbi:MAG TPA: sigma 54-interacting transcriptional regulator [Candidatus Eisenbacteria bacterium]|jgi:formate hydrogenlyase transcriptional activator|nr:sigma 54-interacting transcriptional regulator [Candidatus Eisenbacteria bacterium]
MADPAISPPEIVPSPALDHSRRQLEALLDVSEIIAQHRDLNTLFHELATRLHSVVDSDFLTLVLHDPEKNVMRLHVLESRVHTEKTIGFEHPVDSSPSGWVWKTQQPFIVEDVLTETRFAEFLGKLKDEGVRSFAALPLTTAQHRLGAMGFGRLRPQAIPDSDIQFMQRVAAQVAVAVDNALNFESSQAYQRQLAEQRDRLQVLLDINNVLVTSREISELFRGIVSALTRVIHHDYTSLALLDSATNRLKLHALEFDGSGDLFAGKEITVALDESPAGRCIKSTQPALYHGGELDQFPAELVRILREKGIASVCCVPLITKGRAFGTLNLASRRLDAFSESNADLLNRVAAQVAIAVENALAFKEIDSLKDKLAVEKLYLEEEIRSELNFEEIVGESPIIKRALAQVELAAPANTTVLVLGETGTGKELIARAIHNLSPRRERTFVKVNCAAIPSGLLESELFGHERGAFTGAVSQKIGRFELADRGTIFLDEVGDIPLELQPKLLRVLQEQEFERLGATRTIRVDVRVVAATNADLSRLVADRSFRSDLYYRLNVFPIQIPALRERREDIPLLVRYFVQKFSRRMNKTVLYVPADAMDALVSYAWPGNIRELENLIERAVLLSPGKELRVPLSELRNAQAAPAAEQAAPAALTPSNISTLEDMERQHILRALRQTEWRIAGVHGAASILGMKRTTLQARMRKLGIRRPI